MWHCRNENEHGQNWYTLSFTKSWSVRVASEWSETKAGREVQVFWGQYLNCRGDAVFHRELASPIEIDWAPSYQNKDFWTYRQKSGREF